ncbi:MAG: SipW-dependent-type signal peptide-containing protein [Bacillota bacterium]|nr:SipW-dependent-type signal peptide-containing protein [Bacillota bacterium]
MKMIRKNKRNIVIAVAMLILLAVGAVSAYFTSSDKADNIWTVGEVKIALEEPGWDPDNPPENIAPNQSFVKDPQIRNTGSNDAYVFLKVRIPVANVITADEATGERIAAADRELFEYTMNNGWYQLENGTPETIDEKDYMTYIYAYGSRDACTALPSGNVTAEALFDQVRFINVIEGQGLENTELKMPIEAYGIQTTDLTDNDVSDPASVWKLLDAQTVKYAGK